MSNVSVLSGRVPPQPSNQLGGHDRIFVRDLVLDCHVGVYPEEQDITQKVGFTIEAAVSKDIGAKHDQIAEVPSYDDLTHAAKTTLADGHINLVETIAEEVAARILADERIVAVRIRIEKLERGPGAVGIEIVRPRNAVL